MTRTEFIDNVTTWSELFRFCEDEQLDTLNDYILGDRLDRAVNQDVADADLDWDDLRDSLNEISEGYDAYRRDGEFDYVPMDDSDFDELKDEVLASMDDYWDEEEEEEWIPPVAEVDAFDLVPTEEEPCTIFDLVNASQTTLNSVRDTKQDIDSTEDLLDSLWWEAAL